MHRINPDKLLHSKWTANKPEHRERHFMVTACYRDEEEIVQAVELEAILTRRSRRMDWRDLRNSEQWRMGWH